MKRSLPSRGHICSHCGTEYPPGVTSCPKDGEPTRESASLPAAHSLVGRFIGSYRIKEKIGAGAMGEVFLGEHPTLGKKVAIKVLRERVCADREMVRRFFAEARAVSHLDHPHIVALLDLSVLPDGRAYYVMEHLAGESLSRLLAKKKRLGPEVALPLVLGLLRALAAAHEQGIVHRDVKPANIFLVKKQGSLQVKLLDFGVAKVLRGANALPVSVLTLPGTLLGTPAYMAPEQCRSEEVSPASDLYAVGVVLFEMLSGQLPFEEIDGRRQIEAHLDQEPPRLRELLPEISPDLDALLARALSKDPSTRFTSARQMAQAVRAALKAREAKETKDAPKSLPSSEMRAPDFLLSLAAGNAPTMTVPLSERTAPTLIEPTPRPTPPTRRARTSRRAFFFWCALALWLVLVGVLGITGHIRAVENSQRSAEERAIGNGQWAMGERAMGNGQ